MKSAREVTEEINEQFPKMHLFLHLIKECGFKKVAEIGVAGGVLTKRVLSTFDIEKYYAVDPWKVYVESYDREPSEKETKQEYWDGLYSRLVEMKKNHPNLEIVRMTSVSGSMELIKKDEVLDCIYIDSIHDEENIVKDLYCWLPLVRKGGIVCGHDYIRRFASMREALDKVFGEELNLMIMNPERPRDAYKNTYQGGNWWVEVKDNYWKLKIILKLKDMFYKHVDLARKELSSGWRSNEL